MDAAPQVAVDPRRPKAAVPAPTPTPTPAEVVEVPPSTEEQDSSITTEPPTTSLPESDLSTPDVPTMASEAAPEADRAAMDAAIAATLGELTAISDDMGTAAPEEVEESTNDVAMDVGVEGSDVGVNNVVTALKAEDGNSTPMFSDVSSVDGDAPVAESETVVINPVSKGAAPLSRVAQLSARVEKNPWDGEARLALIGDAETKGDLEKTREAYENFLQFFPDASQQWIKYADLELSHDHKPQVEAIFSRCLRSSTSVDLWKFYLDYIRRINPTDHTILGDQAAKDARILISQSFEFALAHVGQDRRAGDMWMEYINFLKERSQSGGDWENQQKMDLLRKAYQRAVCVPVDNVELIWQEYNQFENNINKMTAKKFIAELSPSYMTARKALRELRALFDRLPMPFIPQPPDWTSSNDKGGLEIWKKYLAWEEANPLDLENAGELSGRVGFAYKKAVASLRFFSEIWYLTANYYLKLGKSDDAKGVLTSGIAANPSSLLLAYTLAELEEESGEKEACHAIYDSLILHFHTELATLQANTDAEIATAMAVFDDAELKPEDDLPNGQDVETFQKTVQEKEEMKVTIQAKNAAAVDSAKRAAANVWITQMRFARRAEGIKQARAVFTKARKSPHLVWQVYEASATMELYWNNEPKIATNIFELGLKSSVFAKDAQYILQYLDFLIRSNNPNNARALFERTVALVEPASAKPVWDRMAQYEYQYGDFLAAQKIFARYSEAFPDASPIERFSQRHGYLGLDDAIKADLGTSIVVAPTRAQRSPSPSNIADRKRGPSAEPRAAYERAPSLERPPGGGGMPDFKRPKFAHEASPAIAQAPNNTGPQNGAPGAWSRSAPREDAQEEFEFSRRPPREREDRPRVPHRIAYALDPRGDVSAPLPDAVVFFLSILPGAASFNGPLLNPAAVVDVIATTMLPGTAPGPGLPGERLGIPPRPKPQYGNESPPRRRGGPPGREPDYSYGGRPDNRVGGGGGGGGGGRRYN